MKKHVFRVSYKKSVNGSFIRKRISGFSMIVSLLSNFLKSTRSIMSIMKNTAR